jgi:hypothetical protein
MQNDQKLPSRSAGFRKWKIPCYPLREFAIHLPKKMRKYSRLTVEPAAQISQIP